MIFGVPVGELAWLAGAILVGGAITGMMAGMFGIGGGAVIVPVLYEVFRVLDVPDEIRMQLCVGTSIAIILPTNLRSFRAHLAKGAVDMEVVKRWAIPAVAGVGLGSMIAAVAPAAVFRIAFAAIACVIAFKMLFGRDSWRIAAQFPGRVGMAFWGLVIGLSSSLMGVSGGSMSNMIQTLYGRSMHQAVATSAGLGVPITIAGTLGYIAAGLPSHDLLPPLSLGFVSLIGLVLMAPVSSFVAPYGARLSHRLPRRKLEIGFGIFLIVVSIRLVAPLI